ncbi:PAS domain-containing protein [Spirosoma sp. SC4-14]|uniref:PAS domain-containing protein n=1 Tax=Spirosoma sp. SC4-14 TaxID=3128900 RepID=UPI0030D18E17
MGKNQFTRVAMISGSLSELPFSDILDFLPDGVVCHEAVRDETGTIIDFRLIYYNKAFESFAPLPYTRELGQYMLGDNPGQEKTLGPIMQQYKQVIETGKPASIIYQDPNLKKIISLRARMMGDGVLVTLRDITIQQMASRQLEEQNSLLHGILNTSLNGTVVYEAVRNDEGTLVDFKFRLFNQTAREQILGYIGKDIAEYTLRSVYPDTEATGMFNLYAYVTETGEPVRREHLFSDLNLWYDVSIAKLNDGCVVTFIDITQLKRATQRANEQAEFVNKLLDGSLNGLIALDPIRQGDTADVENEPLIDLRITSANRAAALFFKYEQAELIGKRLLHLYPECERMGLWAMFERVLRVREAEQMEAYLQTDTSELWLYVLATPRDGEGLVVSFINITERKKAEQHTQALVQELRKTNANLEQFAYVASHDLQEPLRKVTAFGDMLQAQYSAELGANGADMINRMQSAATRMQILIRDLLAYSRIANTKESFGPVNLNESIADVLNDLEVIIDDKKAEVVAESLPIVYGDAIQLRQLFQNLLSNGLKFTRTSVRPQIQISAELIRGREAIRPDGTHLIPEALFNRGFHRIAVADNGIGFEQQYADQIFQVFQRLHNRSQYSGTGIGLSIVQKVVDNHQGFVYAEGVPGQGATFVILLPIKTL